MPGGQDAELAAGLEGLLTAHGMPGQVEDLRRLSGGASRETWSFTLAGEGRRPLVLQRQRPGTVGSGPGMGTEALLLRAAAALGVPVPTVVADDTGDALGAPCLVADRLDGETIARKLLRDDEWATARTRLARQAGAALAAIHRIDPAAVPDLRAADPIEQLEGMVDGFDQPFPAFELALRWLRAHRPAVRDDVVVHGDFRLGNLMVDHDGLAGVLDWEISHLGDPMEDLGWFCVRAWRFGSPHPAGGVGSREELAAGYEEADGGPVDLAVLRWWEVFGTVRWGLICALQAQVHLSGISRSMELAAIGRRVAENEWDALGLLPGGDLPGPAAAPPPGGPDLYGRPTAAELADAVREWLEGDVRSGTEGRLAFHARVAANALGVLERQARLGPTHEAAHAARLDALGFATDAELAAAIRGGQLDDRATALRASIAASVRSKLEVANPRWLEPDG